MKRRVYSILSAAVLLLTMLMCGCEYQKNENGDRLSIVTTCFPPYDFARAVTGDTADITMLLSTGAEAHSYEPTPLDIAKIQQCDVFICVGGEGEVWVDKILDSIDTSSIEVIRLFDYVKPLEEEEIDGASPNGHSHGHNHDHDHNHDHNHDHDGAGVGYDEHIWTSPVNAQLCVKGIEDALCSEFSQNSEIYHKNAENYTVRLSELDENFREMTANASENLIIVGDRFPFRYLAHEYGLEYFAAFSGCSSESEPSVRTMAYLIDEILEHDTDVVFCLEFSTRKLAERLSDATGAKILPLHSCNNVSKDDFESGVTYIELMYENLNNLREALY